MLVGILKKNAGTGKFQKQGFIKAKEILKKRKSSASSERKFKKFFSLCFLILCFICI